MDPVPLPSATATQAHSMGTRPSTHVQGLNRTALTRGGPDRRTGTDRDGSGRVGTGQVNWSKYASHTMQSQISVNRKERDSSPIDRSEAQLLTHSLSRQETESALAHASDCDSTPIAPP